MPPPGVPTVNRTTVRAGIGGSGAQASATAHNTNAAPALVLMVAFIIVKAPPGTIPDALLHIATFATRNLSTILRTRLPGDRRREKCRRFLTDRRVLYPDSIRCRE